MKSLPSLLLLSGLALLAQAVQAQTFTYTPGDLVAAFRQSGAANDLEADLGPVSSFESVPAGQTVVLSQYTPGQLSAAFSSLNSLSFSVFGTQGSSGGVGSDPANTSYLTAPESSPGTQTIPPAGYNAPTAHSIASAINGIEGVGASSGALVYAPNAAAPPSSATALLIPTTGLYAQDSFTAKLTGVGGLQSLVTAPGIENTTPASFAGTPGAAAVSALYEYRPGASSPALLLGDFAFNNSGQLTYTAASVPEPGTLALAVLGGLSLVFARVRRRVSGDRNAARS